MREGNHQQRATLERSDSIGNKSEVIMGGNLYGVANCTRDPLEHPSVSPLPRNEVSSDFATTRRDKKRTRKPPTAYNPYDMSDTIFQGFEKEINESHISLPDIETLDAVAVTKDALMAVPSGKKGSKRVELTWQGTRRGGAVGLDTTFSISRSSDNAAVKAFSLPIFTDDEPPGLAIHPPPGCSAGQAKVSSAAVGRASTKQSDRNSRHAGTGLLQETDLTRNDLPDPAIGNSPPAAMEEGGGA